MKKILLIEDDYNLRETTVELLKFKGYDVVEANNGVEGLEKVSRELPHLILCDIMMPKMDGYEFLKVHISSVFNTIPVLLVSARTEPNVRDNSIKSGAKGFIPKPFHIEELHEMVQLFIL